MVSFCYPLLPVLFLIPEAWMVILGIQMKPYISLAAVVTMVTGALVYHWTLRSRAPDTPAIETY